MENVKVRSLSEDDIKQIEMMDELSGNDVANMVDCDGYAWGLFKGDKLVAYCTIGGADDPDMGYDEYPEWTNESLLLSDVFVKEEYRGQGYALKMLNEVFKEANPENETVFLTLIDDRLIYLYEKLGFRMIEDGNMIKDGKEKEISLEKKLETINKKKEYQVRYTGEEVNLELADRIHAIMVANGKMYISDCDHQECLYMYAKEFGIDFGIDWETVFVDDEKLDKAAKLTCELFENEGEEIYGFDVFAGPEDVLYLTSHFPSNIEKCPELIKKYAEENNCILGTFYDSSYNVKIVEIYDQDDRKEKQTVNKTMNTSGNER